MALAQALTGGSKTLVGGHDLAATKRPATVGGGQERLGLIKVGGVGTPLLPRLQGHAGRNQLKGGR